MLVATIGSGSYDAAAFVGLRHDSTRKVHHNGDDAHTWDGSMDRVQNFPDKWVLIVQGGKEVEVTESTFGVVREILSA